MAFEIKVGEVEVQVTPRLKLGDGLGGKGRAPAGAGVPGAGQGARVDVLWTDDGPGDSLQAAGILAVEELRNQRFEVGNTTLARVLGEDVLEHLEGGVGAPVGDCHPGLLGGLELGGCGAAGGGGHGEERRLPMVWMTWLRKSMRMPGTAGGRVKLEIENGMLLLRVAVESWTSLLPYIIKDAIPDPCISSSSTASLVSTKTPGLKRGLEAL